MNRRTFLGFAMVAPLVPIVASDYVEVPYLSLAAPRHYLVGDRGPEPFVPRPRMVTFDPRNYIHIDSRSSRADLIKHLQGMRGKPFRVWFGRRPPP